MPEPTKKPGLIDKARKKSKITDKITDIIAKKKSLINVILMGVMLISAHAAGITVLLYGIGTFFSDTIPTDTIPIRGIFVSVLCICLFVALILLFVNYDENTRETNS